MRTMVWGEEQEKAFKESKRALVNAPDVMSPSSCMYMGDWEQL
jgi:hypothetical protein